MDVYGESTTGPALKNNSKGRKFMGVMLQLIQNMNGMVMAKLLGLFFKQSPKKQTAT